MTQSSNVISIPGALARLHPLKENNIGTQVVLDLYECETEHLDDIDWVRETMLRAAREADATVVETCFHKFSPWGISGVIVISESHLAIHIWPEKAYAAVDIFTCGSTVNLEHAATLLTQLFEARRVGRHVFSRGDEC